MSEAAPKFFLTTPIYYVNARPHIGHAYTTIVADVLARRHRLLGDDTFFLTGTDEHGQKIERSAAAAGMPPQQFTDQVSAEFRHLWDRMGLTYDKFIRTTDAAHKRGVQKLFRTLQERGHIYLDSYTGAYCVSDEAFVDVPAGAPCPDCGRPTETVTEENYFFRLSAFQQPILDLIESGQLTIEPVARKNEVLSFLGGNVVPAICAGQEIDLEEFDARVKAGLQTGLLGQSNKGSLYLRGALKDLSISRSSFTWGIPVPDAEKHVIYVWLDALANYMTALGYGSDDESLWEKYWPADLHIVGKEIIRFHCVYWPAFLMAAGLPLPKKVVAHGWLLFEESKMSKSKGNIVRTETILDAFGTLCPPQPNPPTGTRSERTPDAAERMPEEVGALAPGSPTRQQRDLFASDVLRYFLLREIPFGQDGSFSFDALITRYNADLANGYGNLISRTLKMIQDYFIGEIPVASNPAMAGNDEEVARFLRQGPSAQVVQHVERCIRLSLDQSQETAFNILLGELSLAITITDKYISENAPWKLAKTPGPEARQQLSDVLATAAESIRIITALLHPFLPFATASVWRQLGLGDIADQRTTGNRQPATSWGGLQPGTKLGPLSPIFPRADKGLAQIMSDMESEKNLTKVTTQVDAATSTQNDFPVTSLASESFHAEPIPADPTHPAAGPRTGSFAEPNPGAQVAGSAAVTTERPAPPAADSSTLTAPSISIDDFAKIELRVARILVAERIPKADKLLRLEVDLGYEKRQILSGIAQFYTPDELIGRRIVVITNLAPRKMRGLESHGMLLAASAGEDGKPVLATFAESDDIPLGTRLK